MPFVSDDKEVDQPFIVPEDQEVQSSDAIQSGAELARAAAVAGGGGFVTNPAFTSKQQLQGIVPLAAGAASVIAPEALMAAVPGLAPSAAAGVLGWLGRLGIIGATGGGSQEAVKQIPEVISGNQTLPRAAAEVAKQAAIGAPIGIAGGVLGQKALQTVGGALREGLGSQAGSLPELLANFKRGAQMGFIRPLFESAQDLKAKAASEIIESITGIKPAQSIGEALGKTTFGKPYTEVEKELGNEAAGALSDDARNAITKSILHTAAQTFGTGATPSQIAELTIAALQNEIKGTISGPAREAIDILSKQLGSTLEHHIGQLSAEASALTAPVVQESPYSAGMVKKDLLEQSQNAWRDKVRSAFDEYRYQLGETPMAEGLPNAKKAVDNLKESGLFTTKTTGGEPTGMVDQFGKPIIGETSSEIVPISKTLNADIRGRLDEIAQAADTPQPIENLRRYISGVNDDINYGVLSTIGDAQKKQLKNALRADLMDALDALPNSEAKTKLIEANRLFSGQGQDFGVDEILSSAITRGAKEFNVGGTAAETLFQKAASNTSTFNQFKTVLGPRFDQFKSTLRDAILTDAQQSALSLEGQFNVGAVLKRIKQVPVEIRSELFPEVSRLEQLALQELKLSGLQKSIPSNKDKLLDWMNADGEEIKQFLGPNGQQAFSDAVRLRAAEQTRYNNAILADVASGTSGTIERNPGKFVDSILSGAYSKPSAVRDALAVVAKHSPKTFGNLQNEYLMRLLDESKVNGIISGKEIASNLASPIAGKSPSPAGRHFEIAKEILGDAKFNSIKQMADYLAENQRDLLGNEIRSRGTLLELLTAAKMPVDLAYLFSSKAGLSRSMGWITDVINKPARLKYQIASSLIQNPQSVGLLSKPIESMSGAEAAQVANAISSAVQTNR